METLSRLIFKAGEEGFLNDFHITNPHFEGLMLSHLLFADDTLVFCKPDESNLGYLRCILLLFEAMSGLRVNLSKSALIPVGDVPNVHVLTLFLGAKLIICLLLILVFLLVLLIRAQKFGIQSLRGFIKD